MIPIRPGTARRLGLRLPPSDVVYEFSVDLSRFNQAWAKARDAGPPMAARVRAAFEEFTSHIKEAP